MHMNTRSTIALLLLAFGVSAFGCVESTEQTDELATIPQEIVLFSAKTSIESPAFSYGFSKADGWQLLHYADVQTATKLADLARLDDTLQSRQQEMGFSGSPAPRGSFSGSVIGSPGLNSQQFAASFSGGFKTAKSFNGKIAGGTGLQCSIYLICDFVEAACNSAQGMAGAGSMNECRRGVQDCRNAVGKGMASISAKEETQFCAMFEAIFSGNFSIDIDIDFDDNND